LAEENGFGSALLHSLLWLVKGTAMLCTWRKEFNKYDLTVLSVSDWPRVMIGAGGLLLVLPQLFAVPVSILWVGLQKNM